MLFAYRESAGHLEQLAVSDRLQDAIWIDLYRPMPAQVQAVASLGVEVPTLEDM